MYSFNYLLRYLLFLILFTSCETEGPVIVTDYAVEIIVKGQIISESDRAISDIDVIGKLSVDPDCSSDFYGWWETKSDSSGKFIINSWGFGYPEHNCIKLLFLPDSNQLYKSDSVIFPNVYFNYVNNLETINLTVVLEE